MANDKTLAKRTNLNIGDIMGLLVFLVWITFVRFTQKHLPTGVNSRGQSSIPVCRERVRGVYHNNAT